ncbi:MAG TPA: RagB/SusD family nutrient uptake outer membrane protein, partial [Sunxiuqinia sp.]|nr:RagB/SusD family nutrient uptake outer membrane protein [Sunxiuqinia sp.]
MKTYKYILVIGGLVAGFFMSGCTNLDVQLTDSVLVESEGGNFTGDPAALLNSAYNKLNDITGSSYTGVSGLNEPTSDEMIIPTRSTDWGNGGDFRVLDTQTWDADHSYILSVWNNMNQAVFYCNQVLASSPSADQTAQAKALRAFFMYNIIDLFGQVPFREVNQGVDENPKVMSRSEAFDFAVKDLEEALPDLIDGGPDADHTVVSKAFVNALLARFYLNKAVYKSDNPAGPYTFDAADMDKVIAYSDAVKAAGFSYESDYFKNFTADGNSEKILTYTGWWSGMWVWPQLHNAQGGWNGATTY